MLLSSVFLQKPIEKHNFFAIIKPKTRNNLAVEKGLLMPNRTKTISIETGKRIRTLRTMRNFTQKDLGDKLFKSESTVRMWELGKSEPDIETINKLSEIFKVSVDFLSGKKYKLGNPIENWSDDLQQDYNRADENIKLFMEYKYGQLLFSEAIDNKTSVSIPVLGQVAAGIPIEAITDILDYEEIPAHMIRDGSEFFALQLKGDSMEPRMKSGDVVIVRKQDTCDSEDIAIVCVNGDEATCKKVIKQSDGILLMPFNSSYSPTFYNKEQIENLPVRIFGKVVELRAKF